VRIRLGLGVVLVASVVATAVFAASGGTTSTVDCSQSAATRVGARYAFDPSKPKVALELCGAFLGPGSEAMVVSFVYPTCWPFQSWAVFGAGSGGWKLVKLIPAYLAPGRHLVAVGGDIRETTVVHRPGDARCLPTGGTRTRTWHWNGSRFTSTPWRRSSPAQPRPALHVPYFRSPSRNLSCGLGDEDRAYCRSWEKPSSVWMTHDGIAHICTGSRRCTGPCDPDGRGDPGCQPDRSPTLAYGQRNDYVGYTCTSRMDGITCTVSAGPGPGKGFRISRDGVTRIR
jgi:hypothetical protein